jgi:hypothetical protein
LEDEGAVPTPEEDMTREQVIRKLKEVRIPGLIKKIVIAACVYLRF